jgi:hypothetical protein
MRIFRRGPKFQDRALSDLSEMFYDEPDNPTPGVELLDRSRLDYTLESLKHVDEYLDAMRHRTLDDREYFVTVLRTGAYVGEVIRRTSTTRQFHWVDYDMAVKHSDFAASLGGPSAELAAILWEHPESMSFPLGKVAKFLDNGPEESTYFFAAIVSGAVEPKPQEPPDVE